MDKLEEYRREIDQLDEQIQRLLVQRRELTEQVGIYKREHQIPVEQEGREKEIYHNIATNYPIPVAEDLFEIYRKIIAVSKHQQEDEHCE